MPRVYAVLQAEATPDAPEVRELVAEIRQDVQAAFTWRQDYADALQKLSEGEKDIRTNHQLQNVYGSGVMWHMCCCRLLVAISPDNRRQMERTAHLKARELMQLIAGVQLEERRQQLLLMQKLSMAQAVLVTAHEWEERGRPFAGKLIDVSLFLQFCQIISDSAQRVTNGAPVLKPKTPLNLRLPEDEYGEGENEGAIEEEASKAAFEYWKWSEGDFYVAVYD